MSFKVGDRVKFTDSINLFIYIRGKCGTIIHTEERLIWVALDSNTAFFSVLTEDVVRTHGWDIDVMRYCGKEYASASPVYLLLLEEPSNLKSFAHKDRDMAFFDNSHKDPPRPENCPWEWL